MKETSSNGAGRESQPPNLELAHATQFVITMSANVHCIAITEPPSPICEQE